MTEQEMVDDRPRRGRPPVSGLAERRRQQIIDAAFDAFTQMGYEQTTIADIARRAGMGQGTVYRYVDGKRELLDLVFDRAMVQLLKALNPPELMAAMAAAEKPLQVQLVADVGARLYQLIDDEPVILKLVTVQAAAADKDLKLRTVGVWSTIAAHIVTGLDEGEARSWLWADGAALDIVARLLAALIIPGFVLSLSRFDDPGTRVRFVAAAARFAAAGIGSERSDVDYAGLTGHATSGTAPAGSGAASADPGNELDRRNQLLDAATVRFCRDGYHAVGVPEIVAEARVSQGTFYNYYRNKRSLLDALVVREFVSLAAVLPSSDVHVGSAEELTMALAGQFATALEAGVAHADVLTFICTEVPGVDERALALVIAFFRRAGAQCAAVVRRGIDSGVVCADVDTEYVGLVLVAFVVGVLAPLAEGSIRQLDVAGTARIMALFVLHGLDLQDAF